MAARRKVGRGKVSFEPNKLTFFEGVERIRRAAEAAGVSTKRVLTSRDRSVRKALTQLRVTNVPSGFTKWQLPVYLEGASQLFITVAQPGTTTPTHSHDEGPGIRFIAAGSIVYKGTELVQGDWMYIPARARYSFETGPLGATMFYCYQCCCA
jgi:hypothetical protein